MRLMVLLWIGATVGCDQMGSSATAKTLLFSRDSGHLAVRDGIEAGDAIIVPLTEMSQNFQKLGPGSAVNVGEVLGGIGSPSALELCRDLSGREQEYARLAGLYCMAIKMTEVAPSDLIHLIDVANSNRVYDEYDELAILALAHLSAPEARNIAEKVLETEGEPITRYRAAIDGLTGEGSERSLSIVRTVFSREWFPIPGYAYVRLKERGDLEARSLIENRLRAEKNQNIRIEIEWSLRS